mmetsp:Transcript_23636/g.51854  ORF Transcript_23636/g.51854 Transcript_23636/m.51854 type:complete len:139 (+) Transcript_23636:224-640(+)
MAETKASLYERLGGAAAIEAAVDIFYKKVLDDTTLSPFFEGIPMDKQRSKQVKFLTYAFGGDTKYNGRTLAAAHKNLIINKGLNLSHFDSVAGHLVATLKELSVPQELIDECVVVVLSVKDVFDPSKYDIPAAATASA